MKKLIAILLVSALLCLLAACAGNETAPAESDTGEPASSGSETVPEENTESEPDSEVSSEKAMENFLSRVLEGNYVIDAGDFLRISVASNEQVVFDYGDDAHSDFAVMSLENEAFQAFLTEDGVENLFFVGEGQAVDAASSRLLNGWLDEEVSGGNIYNLFYNDVENPLRFSSHEDAVKSTLISFAGYSDSALRLMHDVYLTLDAEDPASVRLEAEVDDDIAARINYDDIDVTVTFGGAESDGRVEAWLQSPSYPEARTGWTDADVMILNSVFLPGYGEEAVPFPTFASYALLMDQESFLINDEVSLRDARASEKDVADYAALLLKEGFEKVEETGADGVSRVFYRRLLREDYHVYSSISIEYRDGADLAARKYYEMPAYEGLAAINGVISGYGYPALPELPEGVAMQARDAADELTESWLYFFDYELNLYDEISFENNDQALAYIEAYEKAILDAGFVTVISDEESGEIDRYDSPNGFRSFRYHFEDDGATVTFLFKSERYIAEAEAEKLIRDAGFPPIDLTAGETCRDLTRFQKVQYGADYKKFLSVGESFDDAAAAESYMDAYAALLDEAGFLRVNPENVGGSKPIAFYNEDLRMLVGVDFITSDSGATINFDFRAE